MPTALSAKVFPRRFIDGAMAAQYWPLVFGLSGVAHTGWITPTLYPYQPDLRVTQNVLNKLLNQLQFFKLTADDTIDFDPEILTLYDSVTEEVCALIAKLSSVTQPTSQNIRKAVTPVREL